MTYAFHVLLKRHLIAQHAQGPNIDLLVVIMFQKVTLDNLRGHVERCAPHGLRARFVVPRNAKISQYCIRIVSFFRRQEYILRPMKDKIVLVFCMYMFGANLQIKF